MCASDQKYLGKKGWQDSQAEMNAQDIFVGQGSLSIALGPHIVDKLDMQEIYRLSLANHGLKIGSMKLSHIRGIKYSGQRGSGNIQRPAAEYPENERAANLPSGGKTEKPTIGGPRPFSAAQPSPAPQPEARAPEEQVVQTATDKDAGNAEKQSSLSDTAGKEKSHRKALAAGVLCLLLVAAGGAFLRVFTFREIYTMLLPSNVTPRREVCLYAKIASRNW
jgi:hypothetical protein